MPEMLGRAAMGHRAATRAQGTEAAAEGGGVRETALSYAKRGWHVLPCKPRSKQPATRHGLKDASTDPKVINGWWAQTPDANVAIRCGIISAGLVVIDVDGEEGKQSLMGKKLPPTVIAQTGGGGWHYLYWCKTRLRPKVGLLPKVDLRAEDSYIVAPPSIHPSGAEYSWLFAPEDHTIAELPEWVVNLAQPAVEMEGLPEEPIEATELPNAGRIGRAALDFIANGAPVGMQRDRALAAARNLLEAGYPVKETAKRIWAGLKASPSEPSREPWTPQDALKIAQDLAIRPARPLAPRANGKGPVIESAADLLSREFPPVKWVVDGIIPEGLTILAAKSKIGKTWLCLDVALATAYGGMAFGNRKVDQSNVLYMALEDGPRRVQQRLKMFMEQMPEVTVPTTLRFAFQWPRMDEGGFDYLIEDLKDNPDIKLVVVDTLQRIRPREKGSRTLYAQDYAAIAPLADLAHARNVSIIVVMHTRKMGADDKTDMISGTTGISGAADHILILERARNQGEATMHLTGRDVEEEQLALLWKAPCWELLGEAKEVKMSKERKEVVEFIEFGKGVPVTPKDVADKLGKDIKQVRSLMWKMAQDGTLMAAGGFYSLSPQLTQKPEVLWGSI